MRARVHEGEGKGKGPSHYGRNPPAVCIRMVSGSFSSRLDVVGDLLERGKPHVTSFRFDIRDQAIELHDARPAASDMNAPEGVADGVLLAAEPAAAEPSCRHPVAVIVSDRCCEVLVLVVGSCAPAAIAPAKMTVATPLSHILFCIVSSDAAVCKRCSVGNLWPWR